MMSKRDKFHGRVEDGVARPCNWPDCKNAGAFRAPHREDGDGENRARLLEGGLDDPTDASAWFCLEHVREYNGEWDFFEGMSEDQINAFRDEDAGWHRPTWSTSDPRQGPGGAPDNGAGGPWTGGDTTNDPHGLFRSGRGGAPSRGFKRPLGAADLEALAVLGLEEGASIGEIKTSYKRLAKEHHPDLNNGDPASEIRLRAVIEAYNCLSEAFQDC